MSLQSMASCQHSQYYRIVFLSFRSTLSNFACNLRTSYGKQNLLSTDEFYHWYYFNNATRPELCGALMQSTIGTTPNKAASRHDDSLHNNSIIALRFLLFAWSFVQMALYQYHCNPFQTRLHRITPSKAPIRRDHLMYIITPKPIPFCLCSETTRLISFILVVVWFAWSVNSLKRAHATHTDSNNIFTAQLEPFAFIWYFAFHMSKSIFCLMYVRVRGHTCKNRV